MLVLARSSTADASFIEEILLHTSYWFCEEFLYTPHASFSEEFLIHF